MRLAHARVAPKSRLRRPRRSARLRLTVLYGALFLLSGAVLLTITYALFNRAAASYIGGAGGHPRMVLPGDTAEQLNQLQTQFTAREAAGRAATRAVFAHQLLISSGIALAVVAVIAVILGWFVAGRVLGPVNRITAIARRISETNLSERLGLDGADEEFQRLGDTLDDLFARLDTAFEAQRRFIANASHELRTPLTRERTLVQVALGDPTTSDVWRTTGQELLASNRQQETLIDALLTLASGESGLDHRERTDLAQICQTVVPHLGHDIERLGLRLEMAIRSAPLDGDPRLIECLLVNLVDNAARHNVAGGDVQISTDAPRGKAVLTVTNTGPIIPPSEIDRLFQPFQRLDPGRTHHKNGHGLGLSIVRAIATAHSATITAHPELEGGLSVTITFPTPGTLHGPSGSSSRSERSPGRRRTNRSSVGDPASAARV